MSEMQNIQWFPGHMTKTKRQIQANLKLVDAVAEIIDARIPVSSRNPDLNGIIQSKPRVILLNKCDMANRTATKMWIDHFAKQGITAIAVDCKSGKGLNKFPQAVNTVLSEKINRLKSKGMKNPMMRIMIVGIPNVGKSSLINRLAKRSAAGVQNKPGYTRGEQFIKVNNDFILLDTPGVLPMNYDNRDTAINLALVGSVREDILPNEDLAVYLIKYLSKNYPNALENRFGITDLSNFEEVIRLICQKRGLLNDNERAYSLLLKEFKEGKLGPISLEKSL